MAQEVNWMKLPAMNIQIDPRVSQGMAELQKNSDALKGFPMLSYVSMVMAATANGQTPGSQNNSQQRSTPPPSQSSSSNDAINSPSDGVIKGLGSLFGKKKDNSSAAANNNDVIDIPIQDHPADACGHGGPGHLGQSGPAHGLEDDSVGVRIGPRLNDTQNLLTLRNRIVFSVDNLHVDAQTPCRFIGRRGLLDLIIVVVGGQRNQEF